MTDPLDFENDAQSTEELAAAAVAFETGVRLEVVRVVLDAATERVRRAVHAQLAAHVSRLAQEERGGSVPAWQALTELAEELLETAEE